MNEGSSAAPRSAWMPAERMRVFFALWPDAATAAALHARGRTLRAECGGRLMRRETVHMTLAFLGDVPASRLAVLEEVAGALHAERFVLELDRVGGWHGHRVLWAGCETVPAALQALAAELGARLRAAGFELEARAFNPHVTLVRNALRSPRQTEAPLLRWPVASFVLVASERYADGAHYRVLERWSLGEGGAAPVRGRGPN